MTASGSPTAERPVDDCGPEETLERRLSAYVPTRTKRVRLQRRVLTRRTLDAALIGRDDRNDGAYAQQFT
ncbi:MAG: hypothetical protein ACREMY_20525 [bacterium]